MPETPPPPKKKKKKSRFKVPDGQTSVTTSRERSIAGSQGEGAGWWGGVAASCSVCGGHE